MNDARKRRKEIRERAAIQRRKRFVRNIVEAVKNIKAGITPKPIPSPPIKTFTGKVYLEAGITLYHEFPKEHVAKEVEAMKEKGFWGKKNGDILWIAPHQILAIAFEREDE